MSWITPSADDVKTRLTGAELAAFRAVALAAGQADPLIQISADAVNEARGYIAAGGYPLGDAGTIPPQCLAPVLAIITYRFASRLPLKVSEDRRNQYEDAIAYLRDVAAKKTLIEEATTGSMASGATSKVISSRGTTRAVTSNRMRGL
jgi:phage gp36-like protein